MKRLKEKLKNINLIKLLRCLGIVIILIALGFLIEFCYTRYKQYTYSLENQDSVTEFLETFDEDEEYVEDDETTEESSTTTSTSTEKIIGILEIDDINLQVGFYSKTSYKNSVKYGLQILEESNMPDEAGQFMIASHRGTSSVSYFGKLHTLEIGAVAKVYYKNKVYTYELVKTDEQEKTGTLVIERNSDYPLILITCTQATNGKTQTIYYFSLVSDDTNEDIIDDVDSEVSTAEETDETQETTTSEE